MKPVKAYKQCNRYAQAFIHILLISLKTRFLNIVYHLYFKIAEESRNIYFLQQNTILQKTISKQNRNNMFIHASTIEKLCKECILLL